MTPLEGGHPDEDSTGKIQGGGGVGIRAGSPFKPARCAASGGICRVPYLVDGLRSRVMDSTKHEKYSLANTWKVVRKIVKQPCVLAQTEKRTLYPMYLEISGDQIFS